MKETFCPMIGFNRAGTTLLSSMLDAHPNILFSNEDESVLKALQRGELNIQDMFENVRLFNEKGRRWVNRRYKVDVDYKYEDIKVYGDKKAAQVASMIGKHPNIIIRLCDLFENLMPILVVRNPLDVIAAVYNEKSCMIKLVGAGEDRTIDQVIDAHENIVKGIQYAVRHFPNLHIVHYEYLIQFPDDALRRLLLTLGVEWDEEYINKCKALIKPNPMNRYTVKYTERQLERIFGFTKYRGLECYAEEVSNFINHAQLGVNPDSSRDTAV